MKRRQMIVGAGLFLTLGLGAGQAMAADPVASITRSLEREGYRVASTRRTLLGRVRITATRHGKSREVVIDPRTGEVLRDLVSDTGERGGSSSSQSGSGSTGSGTDDSGSDDSGSDDSGSDDSGSDDSGSDDSGSDDSGSDDSGSDDSGDSSDHGED